MGTTLALFCAGDRRGEPARGPAPAGDGPDAHAAPALPQLLGRCDAGRGLLPHDARGGPAGLGRRRCAGRRSGCWRCSSSSGSSRSTITRRRPTRRSRARRTRTSTPTGRGHSAGLVDAEAPGGSRAEAKGTSLHWGAAAFGLAVHSLAGGVALASAVAARRGRLGHGRRGRGLGRLPRHGRPQAGRRADDRQPDAPRRGRRGRWPTWSTSASPLMIPLGVVLFFLGIGRLGPDGRGRRGPPARLAFSAGTFLCIALSDLLPELQFHAHDRAKLSLALLAGFALMAADRAGRARRRPATHPATPAPTPHGGEGRPDQAPVATIGTNSVRLRSLSRLRGDRADCSARAIGHPIGRIGEPAPALASRIQTHALDWPDGARDGARRRMAMPACSGLGVRLLCWRPIAGRVAAAASPSGSVLRPLARPRRPRGRPECRPRGASPALVFYSTECPISNAYSPTLNRLVEEFPAESVTAGRRLRRSRPVATPRSPRTRKDFGLKFPVVRDRDGALAAQARRDGHARGVRHRRPGHGSATTAGSTTSSPRGRSGTRTRRPTSCTTRSPPSWPAREVDRPSTCRRSAARSPSRPRPSPRRPTPGRRADPPEELPGVPPPRPGRAVLARDLRAGPQAGRRHRRGGRGPPDAPLEARRPASAPSSSTTGRSPTREIATLAAWAEAGAPRATPPTLPAARRRSPTTGRSARPTSSSRCPRTSRSPPTGDDIYRCFVIPTNLPEDVYISAIEYRPGNRRVVHHVLGYVDTTGEARKRDEADPGPGYSCFSGPGDRDPRRPRRLGARQRAEPPPRGRRPARCRAGADVVIQVHYHPSGKPETDRTRIGLYFCRKPVKQTLHWSARRQLRPEAPRRASRTSRSRPQWPVPVDVEALRRHPAHAPARPRHAHDGHLPRRPRPGPDQDRRLGLRLAEHLLLREADRPAQGDRS